MKYIVPEFFTQFHCKCGECRHSCCDGWPIRISRKEYYHLLGIKCSDNLRAMLDCALKTSLETDSNSYAQISTDWRGICKLHREDGLCALQNELGESSLPEVCRLYPRSTKGLAGICTFAFSNSCEKVVELLMNLNEPLKFEEKDLSVNPEFETKLSSQKLVLCRKSLAMLQDRSLSLPDRFISIGNFLFGTEVYSKKPANLKLAFQFLNVLNMCFESSTSIDAYCRIAHDHFINSGEETLSEVDLQYIEKRYVSASEHLTVIYPDWQILFEQLIANHMFYNNFPYISNQESVTDAFLALTITYSFLRFHFLAYMSEDTDTVRISDFFALMFRLIEHSDFRYIVVHLFKEGEYPELECIAQLLAI